jgi:hypothetical protein
MIFKVIWGGPAIRALQSIPWRDGVRVDAAVTRFAQTGEGDVIELPDDEPRVRRLCVDGYRVRMVIDPAAGRLWVVMVYRADR